MRSESPSIIVPGTSGENRRAVVIQTNYIPWKGYFDLIANAEVFVLFDSVQSTKNDWRNRNVIKTHAGKQWLTIPIRHSTSLRIREVEIADRSWAKKHFRSIAQAYARAPFAAEMLPLIKMWYDEAEACTTLSAANRVFIERICEILEIRPTWVDIQLIMPDELHDSLEPSARLVEVCRSVGADEYISGPAAKDYLNLSLFDAARISVKWFDYSGFSEYAQLHGPFDHHVSVLDLLLMVGRENATEFATQKHTT